MQARRTERPRSQVRCASVPLPRYCWARCSPDVMALNRDARTSGRCLFGAVFASSPIRNVIISFITCQDSDSIEG